ncbi:F4 family fimbrial subunit [Escherichia coli]
MKKTLIALAVAASAVVSGSAMAWTANGSGGTLNMGGVLTPLAHVTPWEVMVGDAVTGLDADIQKGQRTVDIFLNKAIPVLGIRAQDATGTFPGRQGISPQISYGDAVGVDAFSGGRAPLTLEIKNASNVKFGTLTSVLASGSEVSWNSPSSSGKFVAFASKAGDGFFGGLGKTRDAVASSSWGLVKSISPEFVAKYNDQKAPLDKEKIKTENFSKTEVKYSAFYGSGIEVGSLVTITLDQAASGDAPIQWKASLPVTVIYM